MTTFDQSEPPVLGVHKGFEVYPMPTFAAMETVDVDALSQWYKLVSRRLRIRPGTPGQVRIVDRTDACWCSANPVSTRI